jgi:hypothetical protein
MQLYKFKSASNLLRLLDIVVHDQLYCPLYADLNDPFEGQFKTITRIAKRPTFFSGTVPVLRESLFTDPSTGTLQQYIAPRPVPQLAPRLTTSVLYRAVDDLPDVVDKRVCSLSSASDDVRMWSLYADSHKGVVVQIDFDEMEDQVHEVKYVTSLPKFNESLMLYPTAIDVLTHKTWHWEYEREYRVIGDQARFSVEGKIRKIILGIRCDPAVADLLQKVVPIEVEICRAMLDHDGVSVRCGETIRTAVFPDPDDDPRGDPD